MVKPCLLPAVFQNALGLFFSGSLSKKPHVTLIYLRAVHAKPGAAQPCFACIICPVK